MRLTAHGLSKASQSWASGSALGVLRRIGVAQVPRIIDLQRPLSPRACTSADSEKADCNRRINGGLVLHRPSTYTFCPDPIEPKEAIIAHRHIRIVTDGIPPVSVQKVRFFDCTSAIWPSQIPLVAALDVPVSQIGPFLVSGFLVFQPRDLKGQAALSGTCAFTWLYDSPRQPRGPGLTSTQCIMPLPFIDWQGFAGW